MYKSYIEHKVFLRPLTSCQTTPPKAISAVLLFLFPGIMKEFTKS